MGEDADGNIFFSQLGEDIIVGHIFSYYITKRDPGFYIDVGAHHPARLSNSALLYARGWHGINIDADPNAVAAFQAERSRDININAGVGHSTEILPFYCFEGGALNTFDESAKQSLLASGNTLAETRMTPVAPLRDLVAQHLAPNRNVDYLNIDIEGRDMAALETYDFAGFPPALITVEDQNLNLHDVQQSSVFRFLSSRGYSLISHLLITSVYLKVA